MRDRERVVLRIESLASGRLGDEHLPAVCLFQKTGSHTTTGHRFQKAITGKVLASPGRAAGLSRKRPFAGHCPAGCVGVGSRNDCEGVAK